MSNSALTTQRDSVAGDPLVQQLMEGLGQAVAVINHERQVLYVNHAMSKLVQVEPGTILGRLPGEAIGCIHHKDGPTGCGSGPACLQCGALNAIQSSQQSQTRVTREARFTVADPHGEVAMDFEVTAAPLRTQYDLTLVSLRDISAEKRRNVLERMFFHDLLNLSGGLQGLLQIWPDLIDQEAAEVQQLAMEVSSELSEEILAGRALTAAECGDLTVSMEECDPAVAIDHIAAAYRRHSVARGRHLAVSLDRTVVAVRTDPTILRRILGNLVKNALEATPVGGTVTLGFIGAPQPTFRVHNPGAMPPDVATQVFHRSFSTKGSTGRGIGTYSVKLLTERYLHGTVNFRSTVDIGTTFEVQLPADF